MLKTIVQREILEYFRSSKFLIGLCLSVILVGISTFINIGDYRQRQQDYLDAKQGLKRKSIGVDIFRKPQLLCTLVQGKDRELGSLIEISFMYRPIQATGYMGESFSQHHRYISGFASVDYAFVVRVVLSLMVIFLAYNSIAEERAQGTLKLALANALPRGKLLFGKFLGGIFVILGSLTIATLTAVLIMLLHPAISLARESSVRILGMWGVSALYLVIFFTLSLMISTIVNRPSIALLVLLQIWIVVIVIYPNLSVILSQHIIELPSEEELVDRRRAIFEPYEQEYKKTEQAFIKMVERGEHDDELSNKNIELETKRTELFSRVDSEYSQELTRQIHLAQKIGPLSPSVLYDSIMQRLARTDIQEFDSLMEGVERYWYRYLERPKLRFTDFGAFKKFKLPEFTYTTQSTAENIMGTLPQWSVLFLLSVIFFVAAHMVFMRKNIG
jgi:ABC-type transport system involved in multi-copper enzyme maturation permease subunit